jgi:hypothetical protein
MESCTPPCSGHQTTPKLNGLKWQALGTLTFFLGICGLARAWWRQLTLPHLISPFWGASQDLGLESPEGVFPSKPGCSWMSAGSSPRAASGDSPLYMCLVAAWLLHNNNVFGFQGWAVLERESRSRSLSTFITSCH